jgi:hypothetical protein
MWPIMMNLLSCGQEGADIRNLIDVEASRGRWLAVLGRKDTHLPIPRFS